MPCFLADQRMLQIDTTSAIQALDALTYPSVLTLTAELAPKELFGPSEITSPRTTVIKGVGTDITFHFDSGRITIKSDIFLPPAHILLNCDTLKDRFITVVGNVITYKLLITSQDDVHLAIDFLLATTRTSLSILFGIFVDVVSLRGEIGNQMKFQSLFAPSHYFCHVASLELADRNQKIIQAVDLQKPWCASYPRFLSSAVYFQHALQLISPHEVLAPFIYFCSEIVVNLSKCLELLLADKSVEGQTNDKIRAKCCHLGYSKEQIEGQIIPILLLRNEFDGAHAIGTKIPVEQVTIIREFVSRAINNVQCILLRVGEYIKTHEEFLPPLEPGEDSRRTRLISSLNTYLKADKLKPTDNLSI